MSTIEEPTIHRIESFEIEKKIEANNEATIDKKEVVPTQPPAVVEDIPTVSYLTLKQFAVTLVKNITGAGILCSPYAFQKMGLIGTILVFAVLASLNVWCSKLLIDVKHYCDTHPSSYPHKEIGNDYAVIVYHILGPAGYMCFLVLYLIAVWGVQVATIISVVDFICTLPWPETFLDENSRRTLFLWVTTGIIILLVLLHDMKPIVMVASLSIFALIISFLILLGYGLITYKLTWKQSFLFPLSATSFFSSIGIPSYSLGYNFSFLSFYKEINPSQAKKAEGLIGSTIGLTTALMVLLPMVALLSYSGKEGGIQQNILTMIPSKEICALIVNIMMYLSVLFSYPIYCPPVNEVLEASVKNKKHFGLFVSDSRRLILRISQTLVIAFIAFIVPNFGDIVSLDILIIIQIMFFNSSGWFCVYSC
ncbi:hypothetical protein WA171_000358 [Blastocystis sp. BT1]